MKFFAKLLFLVLLCAFQSVAGPAGNFVLEHVTVIDGTGRAPQPDQTVVISGGRIAFADLVLLDANPLENISNTRKIFGVIRNGQYLDRPALDALLARARAAAAAEEIMLRPLSMPISLRNAPRFWQLSSVFLLLCSAVALPGFPQSQDREDEIVANLAGGRAIVHVARDVIIFAAIDNPVEKNSIPPRVVDLDATHLGILFGASEWRIPADPKPVRLDRHFQRVAGADPRYAVQGEAESDLETLGTAYLEKLRPLVSQLHHKLDFSTDEPIFQVVIIGDAPNDYGPEVWVMEYRIEQELIATRGDYWQTRILRPRFTQLYPPEKHSPHTIVESRYPPEKKGPTLAELIQGNDPRITHLGSGEQRFSKVLDSLRAGQAQKTIPLDSADFMRAVLPLIADGAPFILGTMQERRGLEWIVPPQEPVEKVEEDKTRPPEAPTLRRTPKP